MAVTHNGKAPTLLAKAMGPEVSFKTDVIEGRKDADERLRELGDSLKPYGMEYLGSACVHFYAVPKDVLGVAKEAAMIEQLPGVENVGEQFVATGFQTLGLRYRERTTGYKYKSLDPKDQRSLK